MIKRGPIVVVCAVLVARLASAQTPANDVDVRVVDAAGTPIVSLTADKFEVTAGGASRQVIRAEYRPAPPGGRVFILVVDASSFGTPESAGVTVAAQAFVDLIPLTESVALVTYPEGPRLAATADRVAIRLALDGIVGQRERASGSPYRRTLDALDAVLPGLAPDGAAQILVLLSAAGDVTETPAPPPDGSTSSVAIGQRVVETHASLHTVLLGHAFLDLTLPPKPGAQATAASSSKDDPALQSWLAQLSANAGGNLIKVAGFTLEPAFARILTETSGSYRLRLEPAARDARTDNLMVRVTSEGAVVRRPNWTSDGAPAAPAKTAAPSTLPDARRAPAPVPVPASADPVVEAYERGDFAAMRSRLGQVGDLPKWIRGLRNSNRPWPNAPQPNAVFALEVFDSALVLGEDPALAEAINLLDYHAAALRDAKGLDQFQCTWYWGVLMLLEGAGVPGGTEPLIERARTRCAADPRVVLAGAFLADVRAPVLGSRSGRAAEIEARLHQQVLDRYEAARAFPDTALEATVRKAWLLHRLKAFDEALALTTTLPLADAARRDEGERQMVYVGYFVRGQSLREKREIDQAAAAYRSAIAVWPEAQSARVALMTLLASNGRRSEAEALAAEVESAPANATDPWWWFGQGDRQMFGALITKLREAR